MYKTFKTALLGTAAFGILAIAGTTTATAQTGVSSDHNFSTWADLVYMNADAGNNTMGIVAGAAGGSAANIDTDYGAGFDLGAAWRVNSGLSFSGSFRYLEVDATGSAAAVTPTNSLLSVFSGPLAVAGETWIDNHVLDFGVTQDLNVGSAIGVSLFGGLRYGGVEQQLNTIYTDLSTNQNSTSGSEFDGIGPRVMASGTWDLGFPGVSIFGHAGASLLVGTLESTLHESGSAGALSFVNEEENQVVSVLELGFGVDYERAFGHGNVVNLHVGYDFETWNGAVGAQQISTSLTERNNLALHGLKAGVTINLAPK